jgi:hypothetical protein
MEATQDFVLMVKSGDRDGAIKYMKENVWDDNVFFNALSSASSLIGNINISTSTLKDMEYQSMLENKIMGTIWDVYLAAPEYIKKLFNLQNESVFSHNRCHNHISLTIDSYKFNQKDQLRPVIQYFFNISRDF